MENFSHRISSDCTLRLTNPLPALNPLTSHKKLKATWINFLRHVIGDPTYSFTLTLLPIQGPRRNSTKLQDAINALSWFVNRDLSTFGKCL